MARLFVVPVVADIGTAGVVVIPMLLVAVAELVRLAFSSLFLLLASVLLLLLLLWLVLAQQACLSVLLLLLLVLAWLGFLSLLL